MEGQQTFDVPDHAGISLRLTDNGWTLMIWSSSYDFAGNRTTVAREQYDELEWAEVADILLPAVEAALRYSVPATD